MHFVEIFTCTITYCSFLVGYVLRFRLHMHSFVQFTDLIILLFQEGPQTMVGIATFDCTIHFYNLKRALQQVTISLQQFFPSKILWTEFSITFDSSLTISIFWSKKYAQISCLGWVWDNYWKRIRKFILYSSCFFLWLDLQWKSYPSSSVCLLVLVCDMLVCFCGIQFSHVV